MRLPDLRASLRSSMLAGVALGCVPAATAFGQTIYQASVVQTSCVGATVCHFVFPAPAANLTVSHVSCNVLTAVGPAPNYAGGVGYFKLFSSAATTTQDFLPSTLTGSYSLSSYGNQFDDATLYAVPAGAAPEITAHAATPIIAPGAIDEPTCFVSGTLGWPRQGPAAVGPSIMARRQRGRAAGRQDGLAGPAALDDVRPDAAATKRGGQGHPRGYNFDAARRIRHPPSFLLPGGPPCGLGLFIPT